MIVTTFWSVIPTSPAILCWCMGLNEVEYTKRQVHLWFQVLLDVCRWNALLIVFSTYLPSRRFKSKILVVKSQFRVVEIPTKFQLLVKSLVYFGKTTISKICWLKSQSLAKSPSHQSPDSILGQGAAMSSCVRASRWPLALSPLADAGAAAEWRHQMRFVQLQKLRFFITTVDDVSCTTC